VVRASRLHVPRASRLDAMQARRPHHNQVPIVSLPTAEPQPGEAGIEECGFLVESGRQYELSRAAGVENRMSSHRMHDPERHTACAGYIVRHRACACCLVAVSGLLFVLAGCTGRQSRQEDSSQPLAGVRLRLAVVGDPAMAAAVRELQGEWNAQTGAEVEVVEAEEKAVEDAASADGLPGDAIVCPSHMLGPWAEKKLLAPVPEKLLRGNADWTDIFDQVRHREANWGSETLAIPFGSPLLVVYYRADLLKDLRRQPPQTWAEYQELAEKLQQALRRKNGGLKDGARGKTPLPAALGTIEPLGPGWAGLMLLARAAPYAQHRDNYSTLFDINTMEPLIAGPPFVRALTELVAAAKTGPNEQLQFDPGATRTAFWQGQCGMAISWPTAAGETPASAAGVAVGFAELPGSPQVYDVGSKGWNTRGGDEPESSIPLWGAAGRIGVVPAGAERQEAAFRLLVWLSCQQSARVCAASPATTIFRQSQTSSPKRWVEPCVPATAADAYADLVKQMMRRQQGMAGPGIPGRAEYLAALDAAVQSAVRGQQSPAEALTRAAQQWKKITAGLGLERQKAAYLRSLGLE
jgi:multiple sugar transport system substrate-binding protein